MRKTVWAMLPLLLSLLGGCTQLPAVSRDTPVLAEQADVQRRTAIRMELASAYYAQAQFGLALQEVDRALVLSPERADAHGLRGLVLTQMGQDVGAEQSLRQAMRLDPADPDLQNNMGWFLCRDGKAAAALPHFDRALSNKSYASPAKALFNAGQCSLRGGDAGRAESYLLRAVDADPDQMLAHASLAQLFYKRADYQRALKHILPTLSSDQTAADDLLMAIRIERKLGDRAAEESLIARLRRLYPKAPQTAAIIYGETDER